MIIGWVVAHRAGSVAVLWPDPAKGPAVDWVGIGPVDLVTDPAVGLAKVPAVGWVRTGRVDLVADLPKVPPVGPVGLLALRHDQRRLWPPSSLKGRLGWRREQQELCRPALAQSELQEALRWETQ